MISFIVDEIDLHYYQAELLLLSISKNTNYLPRDIVVQCVNKIEPSFFNFLNDKGYQYNVISSFLDEKYCNKLQQLDFFIDKNVDGVILLDTDMFVVGDLSFIKGDKVIGKIVDAPNPPIDLLRGIYKEADLSSPSETTTDWELVENNTFDNNFNGGFYYVPKKHIKTVSDSWKEWGEWLYNKPELFNDKSKFIHVDQISFSLAIHSNKIEYQHLQANYNYPIHSSAKPSSFSENEDLKILHYHHKLDVFGCIESDSVTSKKVIKAINIANDIIVNNKEFTFLKKYKKSLISPFQKTEMVNTFEKRIKQMVEKSKINMILHAGTPKTGTTSLQFYLHNNKGLLLKEGYLYPEIDASFDVPKHQWLVACLLNNDFDLLFNKILDIHRNAVDKGANTIILSTEGIYNHWSDYSAEAKCILHVISLNFNLTLWVIFRDPKSFLESFYKQNLKNPQLKNVDCYGKDLSFSESLKDKWFLNKLDYLGFVMESKSVFGSENVKLFNYSKNIVNKLCDELNLNRDEFLEIKSENKGQSSIAVELLRVINRYNLSYEDKNKVLKKIDKADTILIKYATDSNIVSIQDKQIIAAKLFQSKVILKEDYNLEIN